MNRGEGTDNLIGLNQRRRGSRWTTTELAPLTWMTAWRESWRHSTCTAPGTCCKCNITRSQSQLHSTRRVETPDRPPSWRSWSHIWQPNICQTAKFSEVISNRGRRAIVRLELWKIFRTAVLTLNFDLDLSDVQHLCQIWWKSDLQFSRNHNERNQPTNQSTNEQTNQRTHSTRVITCNLNVTRRAVQGTCK